VEREDCSSRRDKAKEKEKKIRMEVILQTLRRKKSRNFIYFICNKKFTGFSVNGRSFMLHHYFE
jgi:hypothetical protein